MKRRIAFSCAILLSIFEVKLMAGDLPPSIQSGRATAFVPARFDRSTWANFANVLGQPEKGSETSIVHWNKLGKFLPLEKFTQAYRKDEANDLNINLARLYHVQAENHRQNWTSISA